MSEITSTNGDAATKATANGHNHLKQKRARSQLSCTPCRAGKLKCNREHDPACDQCIKRNRESSCVYLPPPAKHKPTQNVKGRIRQLESLVVDLMNRNENVQAVGPKTDAPSRNGLYSQPTPPSDSDTSPQFNPEGSQESGESPDDVDAATAPFGQMKISKNEISYVGESHWGAILNSISDLKKDIEDEDEGESDEDTPEQTMNSWRTVPMGGVQPYATSGLGFMLGDSTAVTKEQLISSMPEKRVVDRLLSLWFNSPDPFKPIIHAPTFQDEYRRFWRNPKDVPVMWLGLLYAIMSLAASFGLRDVDPVSPQAQVILEEVNKYHSLSASAAVLADFTKPKQHTLECLILYAAGLRSNNAFVNVWLMIGLVVRLALRMGYHRDPSHYPGTISMFHGEMRRRVWAIISMIDVLISFQIGLPSIIKTVHSDTQPPRNLLDRDFNMSTQVLPASRGVGELTPSSYTRAKLRIVRVFANAAELSHATVAPSHEETERLDQELEEAKAAVPPLLQMPDISELVTDPAEQLMCRFNLDLLYMKTKIVLHRRYMLTPINQLSAEEQKRGIGVSRKACIDCALRVLQHHQTIYTATQAGGQLESVKWYMCSISTHDFLLAAMIICLELSTQMNNASFRLQPSGLPCPKQRAMMEALERSQQIWSNASGRKRKQVQFTGKDELAKGEHMYDETEKAGRAMAVMVEKVKTQMLGQTPQPSKDASTPMSDMMHDLGIPPGDSNPTTETTYRPFNGVVSTYEWGDMAGVPDDFGAGDQVFFANNGGVEGQSMFNPSISFNDVPNTNSNSQSTSNGASPDQANYNRPDFSLIGDMLDVPLNLDWEMWDNQIIKGQQPAYGFSDDDIDSMDFNIRFGNTANGGTGPVAGNAIYPNGTGATSAAQNFTGIDYNLGMMDDVGFDAEHNLTTFAPLLAGQDVMGLKSAPA